MTASPDPSKCRKKIQQLTKCKTYIVPKRHYSRLHRALWAINKKKHMNKILILFAVILLFNNGHSQSTNDLDNKKGFKSYKLGKDKSTFEERLKLDCIQEGSDDFFEKMKYFDGCKVFNNPDKNLFSFSIKELYLKFDTDNKLDEIKIELSPMLSSNISELYDNFKYLFGKHTNLDHVNSLVKGSLVKIEKNHLTISEIRITWKGKNVSLEIESFYNTNKFTWNTSVKIVNLRKKIESGF